MKNTSEGSGPVSGAYTAANIRILSDEDVAEKFEWAHIGALAAKYGRLASWIECGFRACEEAGVSPDYFVARYLEKDGTPEHEGVTDAFKRLYWPGRRQ